MVQSRILTSRRHLTLGVVVMAMVLAALWQRPAIAEVTSVQGLAFNYYTDVSLFGGPSEVRGYGQSSDAPATASSPSVECPDGGGTDSGTDPDGAAAQYGPAVIFGGIWPEELASAPPSGPLTSSIDCQLGEGGYVTASTEVTLMPQGSAHPGGVGPGPVVADDVRSTCTAEEGGATGSTTIVNGTLETSYDPNTQEPVVTEPIPDDPEPNYRREGTIDHVGDSYEVVFNEHVQNEDGSLTVNAVHMRLLGPTAVGDMIIGSVTCGVNGTTTPTTPTTDPTTPTTDPTTPTTAPTTPTAQPDSGRPSAPPATPIVAQPRFTG